MECLGIESRLRYFFFLFFVISLSSQAESILEPNLKKREGYLLVKLNVEGVAPSIEYRKQGLNKKYTLRLNTLDNGFALIPMAKGKYQVSQVNVPFFDLPHRLDTKNSKEWSFVIEKHKVNYIGELKISKERSQKSVDVNLYKRVAKEIENIEQKFAEVLTVYPLAVSGGFYDEFYQELKGEPNDE